MNKFQNRHSFRRYLGSPILTIALILVLAFLFESGRSILLKSKDAGSQYQRATFELENMESKKDFLESEIQYVSTERGREEEIRKKFGVVEDGELMAVIIEPEGQSDFSSSERAKKGFWRRVVDFFR